MFTACLSTLTSIFPPHLPLHTSSAKEGVRKAERGEQRGSRGSRLHDRELLCGNRLAHFRGQKGICFSKESPLFTFIAETQPRSDATSLTTFHAHTKKNTYTHTPVCIQKVYWKPWYCSTGQTCKSICRLTYNLSRTKETWNTRLGVYSWFLPFIQWHIQIAIRYSSSSTHFFAV